MAFHSSGVAGGGTNARRRPCAVGAGELVSAAGNGGSTLPGLSSNMCGLGPGLKGWCKACPRSAALHCVRRLWQNGQSVGKRWAQCCWDDLTGVALGVGYAVLRWAHRYGGGLPALPRGPAHHPPPASWRPGANVRRPAALL